MISVIVPVYNVAKYLKQCIESIRSQTFKDLEIILVNDGSTDECHNICEEYQKKDSRIVVIHKENGGLVSARKAGLRAASGEYIAYVDGDDWIEPDMYERMFQMIMEQDVDVVMCGRFEDIGDIHRPVCHGIKEGRYNKKALLNYVYPRMIVNEEFFTWGIFPSVWDKLFRRKCVEPFQMMVDERIVMGEDAACVYPCLLNAQSIYIMDKCLYHYRQTTSSMVKQLRDYDLERMRFHILYRSVDRELEKYKCIYDLSLQWRKYVLFLAFPRADCLYEGYADLNYLFPFSKVFRGNSIVLYGAGTYGQRLYKYIQKTHFCNVLAWVDQSYCEYRKLGLPVDSPEILEDKSYDGVSIVVAVAFAKPRHDIYVTLTDKCQERTIHLLDEDLILSQETMEAMGL